MFITPVSSSHQLCWPMVWLSKEAQQMERINIDLPLCKQRQEHLANSCSSLVTRQESFRGQAEGAAYSPHSTGQKLRKHLSVRAARKCVAQEQSDTALVSANQSPPCLPESNALFGVACKAETIYIREVAVTTHLQHD